MPSWQEFSTDPGKQTQANGWRALGELVVNDPRVESLQKRVAELEAENHRLRSHPLMPTPLFPNGIPPVTCWTGQHPQPDTFKIRVHTVNEINTNSEGTKGGAR